MENNNLKKIVDTIYSSQIKWEYNKEGPGKGIYCGELNDFISLELGQYNGVPTSNQEKSDFFYLKIKGTMPQKPFTIEEIRGNVAFELYNDVSSKYKKDQEELKELNKNYFNSFIDGCNEKF